MLVGSVLEAALLLHGLMAGDLLLPDLRQDMLTPYLASGTGAGAALAGAGI